MVTFSCRGHRNITGTHAKTLELTRDAEITARATCVIGVASNHDDRALLPLRGRVKISIECNGVADTLIATVSPFFLGDTSLVVRRGDDLRAHTAAYDATKTAADLDRELIGRLGDPTAEIRVTIEPAAGETEPGALFVVSLPIGNDDDLSPRARAVLANVDVILAEDTRRLYALARRVGLTLPRALSYHDHNEAERADEALTELAGGARVALVSDAGTPLTSDPGYVVVSRAVAQGIPVVPVPGPSAGLAALTASGLPVDRFVFAGFLPRGSARRQAALRAHAAAGIAIVCYEAPTRVAKFLADVAAVGPEWRVCVAREVTKIFEEFRYGTASELAAEFAAHDDRPLGEFTIVVLPEVAAPDAGRDDALLRALLKQGVAPSTLAHALKDARGVRRNAAYEHVLGLES